MERGRGQERERRGGGGGGGGGGEGGEEEGAPGWMEDPTGCRQS